MLMTCLDEKKKERKVSLLLAKEDPEVPHDNEYTHFGQRQSTKTKSKRTLKGR